MTLIQQQIKSVFVRLPQEIRDLITSEDFNDRIEVIAKKHGLDEDQTGALIRTTVRLLIGVIAPTQFVVAVTENIEIDREKASLIAQDINRDIFNPVKEELKQVHALPGSGASSPAPKPASPTPASAPVSPLPQVSPKPAPVSAVSAKPAPAASAISSTPPLAAPSQSIFEQKMGGTFRMKSDTTSHGAATQPKGVAPSAVMPDPTSPPKIDPYREAP